MREQERKEKEKIVKTTINEITILRYISSGGFGDVYEGLLNGQRIALKIPIKNKHKNGEQAIIDEYNIYKKINKYNNPNKFEVNLQSNENGKFIVMDLFGESFEKFLRKKELNIKEVAFYGIQMINIVRHIHKSGYVHRDLKPDNFVFDLKNPKKIFCIDFGLAKEYENKNGDHVKYRKSGFCGTALYASINTHKFKTQSRRDDLESIGYILIYLIKKNLPWYNIKHKDKKTKYELIRKCKENTNVEELCKDLPDVFKAYFNYVKELDFDEKPLYNSLKKLLQKLL